MNLTRQSLAVVGVAADSCMRFAMNHVCVDTDGTTIATDGHCLLAVQPQEKQDPMEKAVLVDGKAVKMLLARMPRGRDTTAEVSVADAEEANRAGDGVVAEKLVRLSVQTKHGRMSIAQNVAGTFPNVLDVLKQAATVPKAAVVFWTPAIIEQMMKTFRQIAADETGIAMLIPVNRDAPTLVMSSEGEHSVVGAVMPRTDYSDGMKLSEWDKKMLGIDHLPGAARPEIVCLCGSTRFTEQMLVKQWQLTKAGKIVLSWCALPDSYHKGPHVGDHEGVKEIVDEVHKRKIDLADSVFVIDVDGYIGDSTRSEIEYATRCGKPVQYLSQEEPPVNA